MTQTSQPSADDGADVPVTAGPVRDQFDWSQTTPSTAVARTVAAATAFDATTNRPLYESIDPDAIDALFGRGDPGDARLSFTHGDLDVTVTGSGTVTVRPADDAGSR